MSEEQNQVIRYGEFAKDPEAVIDNSNLTGEPVVVTGRGRLLFLIEPLDLQTSTTESEPSE